VPFHVGIQIRNVRCLVAATRMAASIDFHDRFGEPELTALGRSRTVALLKAAGRLQFCSHAGRNPPTAALTEF
jgi:hypothetical protein